MNFTKNLKISIVILVVASCLLLINCSPDETQTVTNFNNLTMSDEFSTTGALDLTKWSYEIGNGEAQGIPGWGNNELQYYTDRLENVVVEDGMLKIRALQEDFEGLGYTSGRILTQGKFQQKYGRFEARIKLPWGQGLWPAFWMLGDDNDGAVAWPQRGEIDIMENRGQEPTLINGSVHGPGYSGAQAITKAYELDSDRFDTGFHVFGIEWGENYINYYVDDVLYNQITPSDLTGDWVFDNEFFIIINVAVGGNYVGSPNEATVFPQEMLVDYVRVYSAD
ncbi:family 16 glycosylhydrolase [Winogradskyella sp. PG-2]|uniref:glycoside hydrolase family 16 protein n=1 Tax=Winogradskyella sp. PG-2 TaxID=754409 RepID=UPI0005EF43DC|nr:glycoside hydrolase family 16 protein [Winogradskyella sp. PG-2]